MSAILNATPQANLQGARSQEQPASQAVAETLPQFLPHIFFFAQKGPLTPQLVDGDSFEQLYGIQTQTPGSAFYFHTNALAANVFANGGSIMAQRLEANDAAPPATVSVALDLLATTVQITTNTNGVTGTSEVPGYIGKIVVGPVPGGVLGQQQVGVGSQSTTGGVQSQLYPLWEQQVSSGGSDGNNQGFAISCPTTETLIPADTAAMQALNAFIYNFRQISRTSPVVTGLTVPTFEGDQYVPFTLAPNSLYTATNTQYALGLSVIQAYENENNPGNVPVYPNFGGIYVYQENIDTVLAKIFTAEYNAGGDGVHITGTPTQDIQLTAQAHVISLPNGANPGDIYQVNLFGATDVTGTAYQTFSLVGASQGGTLFTDNTTIYASGGSDGTMSFSTLDNLVQQQLLDYNDSTFVFTDMAMWPQSWFFDSGFSITTKEAAGNILATRKDMGVVVATQDVSLPQNSAAADSSTAISLSASLSQYTESQVYGTPVCRAVVMGQSGNLISSTYTGLLPLSIDLAGKMAAFMGAGNGYWTPGNDFTIWPANKCTIFKNVNATSKSYQAYVADWTNNLVWAQTADRATVFYPAFQTVYDDDSSVLNSLKTVAAVIELEKVCFRTWQQLTGRNDLTQDQLIKQSNNLISNQVPNAKFAGNFQIKPDTYFTPSDTAREYSFTCDVILYANPMITVGTFTIDARNMSALSTTTTSP
jgi:hypothetical protein